MLKVEAVRETSIKALLSTQCATAKTRNQGQITPALQQQANNVCDWA